MFLTTAKHKSVYFGTPKQPEVLNSPLSNNPGKIKCLCGGAQNRAKPVIISEKLDQLEEQTRPQKADEVAAAASTRR